MDIVAEVLGVIRAFQSANIDFAVCGGIAMAMHGLPRFTTDIDLLLQPHDLDCAVLVLEPLGFSFDASNLRLKMVTVRRIMKIVGTEYLALDLMLVNDWLTPVWEHRILVEWEGLPVPVVSATGLARMKRVAGRSQDLVDIERLGFSLDDPTIQTD